MKPHCVLLLVALTLASSHSAAVDRPEPPPGVGTAEARARTVVDALRAGKPELANAFFFPAAEFGEVKAAKDPSAIFRRLIGLYHGDLLALRKTLKDPEHVEFVSFRLANGRNWIERFKEANKLPYWAVYGSTVMLRDAGRLVTVKVRVMISWKGQWVVTHLTRK